MSKQDKQTIAKVVAYLNAEIGAVSARIILSTGTVTVYKDGRVA